MSEYAGENYTAGPEQNLSEASRALDEATTPAEVAEARDNLVWAQAHYEAACRAAEADRPQYEPPDPYQDAPADWLKGMTEREREREAPEAPSPEPEAGS